jgi:hypothetical protein
LALRRAGVPSSRVPITFFLSLFFFACAQLLNQQRKRKLSTAIEKDKNLVRKIRQGRHRLGKAKGDDNEIKIHA